MRYLRMLLLGKSWRVGLRHRHSKAANAHSFPLENGVDEALYCFLKQDVANVADLGVSLGSRAWIQYEAEPTELFHLALVTS